MKYFCLGMFASTLLYIGGLLDGMCAAVAPYHILHWVGIGIAIIGVLLIVYISTEADKK